MGTTISLTSSDGFELSAYRAEPEGGVRGGVVVVQEIFGVNSHIRSVADRYAAAGYLAIAPAIFDRERPGIELGYTEDDIAVGRDIARGKLDFATVLADVAAAGACARDAGKVGVVGYCYGGLVTAAAAIRSADVFDAAVFVLRRQHREPDRSDTRGPHDHALRRTRPRHPARRCAQDLGGLARRDGAPLRRRARVQLRSPRLVQRRSGSHRPGAHLPVLRRPPRLRRSDRRRGLPRRDVA